MTVAAGKSIRGINNRNVETRYTPLTALSLTLQRNF